MTETRPGNGARVRLENPVKGTVWYGEVLQWVLDDPQVRLDTGKVRYFPGNWVTEVSPRT